MRTSTSLLIALVAVASGAQCATIPTRRTDAVQAKVSIDTPTHIHAKKRGLLDAIPGILSLVNGILGDVVNITESTLNTLGNLLLVEHPSDSSYVMSSSTNDSTQVFLVLSNTTMPNSNLSMLAVTLHVPMMNQSDMSSVDMCLTYDVGKTTESLIRAKPCNDVEITDSSSQVFLFDPATNVISPVAGLNQTMPPINSTTSIPALNHTVPSPKTGMDALMISKRDAPTTYILELYDPAIGMSGSENQNTSTTTTTTNTTTTSSSDYNAFLMFTPAVAELPAPVPGVVASLPPVVTSQLPPALTDELPGAIPQQAPAVPNGVPGTVTSEVPDAVTQQVPSVPNVVPGAVTSELPGAVTQQLPSIPSNVPSTITSKLPSQ